MNNQNDFSSPQIPQMSNDTPLTPNNGIEQGQIQQNVVPQEPVVQSTIAPQQPVQTEIAPQQVIQPTIAPQQVIQPTIAPQQVVQPQVTQQVVQTEMQVPTNDFSANTTLLNNGIMNGEGVGFVSEGKDLKKKMSAPLKFGLIAAVLVIVAVVGYFVVYPFVMNTFVSTPKNIFSSAINSVAKNINNTADEYYHNSGFYSFDVKLDSNIDALSDFSGFTYYGSAGINPEKELLEGTIGLKKDDSNDKHASVYVKDAQYYFDFSSYNDLILGGSIDEEDMQSLKEIFDELKESMKNTDSNDVEYLVNTVTKAIDNSMDKDKFIKNDRVIKVNNTEINAKANTYVFDATAQLKTEKSIYEAVLNDEKALEILANITSEEVKDLKESINEEIKELDKANRDDIYTVSILTTGVNASIVGYEVIDEYIDAENKDYNTTTILKYYFDNNGNFDASIESSDSSDEKEIYTVSGVKSGDKTNVVAKNEDTKLFELEVFDFEENKIKFNYKIYLDEDEEYKGNVNFEKNESKNKVDIKLDFSVNVKNEYIKIYSNLSTDWGKEIADINTKTAKSLSEEELENVLSDFMSSLSDTPVGSLFSTLGNDWDDDITDYYGDYSYINDDYDSYDSSKDEYSYSY